MISVSRLLRTNPKPALDLSTFISSTQVSANNPLSYLPDLSAFPTAGPYAPFHDFLRHVTQTFTASFLREALGTQKLVFDGPYTGGVRRGTGACSVDRASKDVYVGAYVDGKRHGHGMMLYLGEGEMQFSVYKGEWHNDHP
jgi:hypothetical protein